MQLPNHFFRPTHTLLTVEGGEIEGHFTPRTSSTPGFRVYHLSLSDLPVFVPINLPETGLPENHPLLNYDFSGFRLLQIRPGPVIVMSHRQEIYTESADHRMIAVPQGERDIQYGVKLDHGELSSLFVYESVRRGEAEVSARFDYEVQGKPSLILRGMPSGSQIEIDDRGFGKANWTTSKQHPRQVDMLGTLERLLARAFFHHPDAGLQYSWPTAALAYVVKNKAELAQKGDNNAEMRE